MDKYLTRDEILNHPDRWAYQRTDLSTKERQQRFNAWGQLLWATWLGARIVREDYDSVEKSDA